MSDRKKVKGKKSLHITSEVPVKKNEDIMEVEGNSDEEEQLNKKVKKEKKKKERHLIKEEPQDDIPQKRDVSPPSEENIDSMSFSINNNVYLSDTSAPTDDMLGLVGIPKPTSKPIFVDDESMELSPKYRLHVFYTDGHASFGLAPRTIVIASNLEEAYKLLDNYLYTVGLNTSREHPYEFKRISMVIPKAYNLGMGDDPEELLDESEVKIATDSDDSDSIFNLYAVDDHDIIFPYVPCSVIVANDRLNAIKLLDKSLESDGLKTYDQKLYSVREIKLDVPRVECLFAGKMKDPKTFQ
jgi:hypothetical protein